MLARRLCWSISMTLWFSHPILSKLKKFHPPIWQSPKVTVVYANLTWDHMLWSSFNKWAITMKSSFSLLPLNVTLNKSGKFSILKIKSFHIYLIDNSVSTQIMSTRNIVDCLILRIWDVWTETWKKPFCWITLFTHFGTKSIMVSQSFLTIKKINTTKSWSKYNLIWWSLFKLMTWESSTKNISDWNNMSNMLMPKSLLKSFISKDNKIIEAIQEIFWMRNKFSIDINRVLDLFQKVLDNLTSEEKKLLFF